ncbi:protein LEKR1 isoform X3 [Triplophysa dalaica]|uniref:protein LEKR1 isoform X3 n=1 Tax=Triplophysa dalaica TaxID=1582913 RepID=UPI0024DFC9B6|nr:protein LEKR1 isoform X3 [Triplophysa dalaica]
MEETPRERSDKEEMEIHTPAYPLPREIQQMDQTEKACRYCGVSYLILHEFQRLQERLQEVERELERARGSVERERAVRVELRQALDHLDEMKAAVLQQEDTTRALDLQLCVVRHEMESVRTDKERVCTELENEHARRLHLRWRCEQQQQVLEEALALLKSSHGQMTSIKSRFTHFQENWEDSKALIQQSCIIADAGLREEMKTLNEDLQNNKHEREIVKKLLVTKSAEKEELQELWSKQARDQKAGMERLSRDLREKEESRLSCQQRCESLQEQLLAWQQKEEEMTRRLEQAEAELKDLRAARSNLQQERFDTKELRRIHAGELERLQESFRTRLEAAEQERNSKMEACLEQKQAEKEKQLKELEMELRRDAVIELDIQRQKNQELLQKYQNENQQLQKKVPAMIHLATQELHEEIAVLQECIKQQGEACESAPQREQQALQREGDAQLQSALQDLQQAQKQLQQLKEEKTALEEEKYLLEETVRRECEEREELTSALTLAREQLLDLKHISMNPRDTQTHTRLSRSTLAHPDPPTSQQNPILLHNHPRNNSTPPSQGTRRKSLGEWHSGIVTRSLASSHEISRPVSTLPKINKNGIPLVNDCKTITSLLSRRDKL